MQVPSCSCAGYMLEVIFSHASHGLFCVGCMVEVGLPTFVLRSVMPLCWKQLWPWIPATRSLPNRVLHQNMGMSNTHICMAMVPHWSLIMISKVRAGTLALDISLASMIMQNLFMMATTRIWAWNGLGNQRNMVTSRYE